MEQMDKEMNPPKKLLRDNVYMQFVILREKKKKRGKDDSKGK
ncbi:hypothetical protein Gotri_012546, partial [Gossypium trilobum]|nr:hypothetical protein [Gossypium trilobum]